MWTDERVAKLRKLWSDGYSASQIAKQLEGVTRNAVIGKVHRLGLAGRNPKIKHGKVVVRTTRVRVLPLRFSGPKLTAAARTEAPQDFTPLAPIDPTLGVLRLNAFTCRYPSGDPKDDGFAFCGRTCEGPYCRDHMRLCYPPQSQRRLAQRIDRLADFIESNSAVVA